MSRMRMALSAAFILVAALAGQAADFGAWTKTMPVTLTGYDRAGTLTNFPVLVRLDEGLAGFSYDDFSFPQTGADLRFTASNRTDELNYEIEKWDTGGVSLVWVQIPLVDGPDARIWAFWGNAAATAPAYATNGRAWDAGQVGVWHMAQTNATDSSSNRFNGTAVGTVSQAAGMIGGANEFDADLDYVQIPDSPRFTLSGAYTVSAWIRPDPLNNDWQAIVGSYSGSSGFIFAISTNADNRLHFWAGLWRTNSVGVPDNAWSHVAYTRNGTSGRFYVNGELTTNIANAVAGGDGGVLQLGAGGSGWTTQRFDGRIDEVRISVAERGSNWIWASWANQVEGSTFAAFGAVQDVLVVDALPAEAGVSGATLHGRLANDAGAPATEVAFCWGPADAGTGSTGVWPNVVSLGDAWVKGDAFSTALAGLASGGTYVYRCYASNAVWGTAWSATQSFTTVYLPAVTNTGATVLSYNTALLQGAVTDPGSQTPSVWFLYWVQGSDVTNAVALGPQTGACSTQVTGLVASGSNHVFMLMASNAAGVAYSGTNGFTLGRTFHVAVGGNNTNDGLSWAAAVSHVEVAVQRAGPEMGVVLVGDGNFAVTSSWILVTNAIALTSLNGPAATSLDSQNVALRRVLYVNHPRAVVSGLTLKRGRYEAWSSGNGPAGLQLTSGLVSNCVITANLAYYYGGVYMNGGVLADCFIHGNTAMASSTGRGGGLGLDGGEVINCVISNNQASINGGGVFMTGGRLRDCQIVRNLATNNYTPADGGGVYMSGGTIERSLIRNNAGLFKRGGGAFMAGGTLLNCLVTGNTALFQGGGLFMSGSGARVIHGTVTANRSEAGHGLYLADGAVSNSLVIANGTTYAARGENVVFTGGTFAYSATAPLLAGPGNIVVEPRFADAAAGDYRLLPGSPCIDAAAPLPAVTTALGGTARALDGDGNGSVLPDMGAYETATPAALACAIESPTNEALLRLDATLNAVVRGTNTAVTWYGWDVNNDGVWDYAGAGLASVAHTFGVGFHTVKLAVTNAALEGAVCVMPDYIRVAPLTNYVARGIGNSATPPFDTWERAASNVVDGLDAAWIMPGAGAVVLVSNGTYVTPRTVRVAGPVTVRSLNGPAVTIVDASAPSFGIRRAFLVNHADAVLEGFTGRGGSINDSTLGGAGLWLINGWVSNCFITANTALLGNGVYMNGGRLAASLVANNTCGGLTYVGGALNLTGGIVERCLVRNNSNQRAGGSGLVMSGGLFTHGVIASNTPTSTQVLGGGLSMSGGTLRNSLIAWNGSSGTTNGGGAVLSGGLIESCTIASNRATSTGGGLAIYGGVVSNSIIAYNNAPLQVDLAGRTQNCAYCCSPSLTVVEKGNISTAPVFQNRLLGDFRLAPGSAGINQGFKLPWMEGALDLSGSRRLAGFVDMGAYESPSLPGTVMILR